MAWPILPGMLTTEFHDPGPLRDPVMLAALDGWVDAGTAASLAVAELATDATLVASFDADQLYDYRSRRPTLEIVDGRLTELTWPELALRHARLGGRDLLILAGHEPDDRWRALGETVVDLARRLGAVEWISLGSIPAAVPHTRAVPILGTASDAALLKADVPPGPAGVLRVPAAAISVLEMAVTGSGIPALGYFAQVPHYVSGPYPAAAVELLRILGTHLGVELPLGSLDDDARQLRSRLDAAAVLDESSRQYIERLESMADESRLPSGDDLIADIERFLRDRGTGERDRS